MSPTVRPIPIAVFCYNRPVHLRATLEALERCEEFLSFPLHIFCDAPAKEADAAACAATQKVAHDWVASRSGAVKVRETNLKFGNITRGVSELCDDYGWVIVIEDDIIVSPDFLSYMRRSLLKYWDDAKVMLISGYIYPGVLAKADSPVFLPSAFVWGWATWQRAWKHYAEWCPNEAAKKLADRKWVYRFNYNGTFGYSSMLEEVIQNPTYTWDIQWSFLVHNAGGLGLCPPRPLVWNAGVNSGVHFGKSGPESLDEVDPLVHGNETRQDFLQPRLKEDWQFPEHLETDAVAFASLADVFLRYRYRKRTWKYHWKKFVRGLFS